MEHLTNDVLARLVDEAPGAAEGEHLAACAACREERDALREQGALLGALGRIDPPAGSWDAVQARLRDEGLLRFPAERRRARGLRAAAAVLVALTASALTLRAIGGTDIAAPVRVAAVPANAPAGSPAGAADAPVRRIADGRQARATRRVAATVPTRHATVENATEAGGDESGAIAVYPAATPDGRLAAAQQSDALPDDSDALERLAAWEGLVLATGDALELAPADPVANGFHFAALQQRDAALRTLALTPREPWF